MKKYNEIFEAQKEYVLPTYSPELLFVKGEGSYLQDQNGKKYLDFTAGIAVCSLGHCHPNVTKAISDQANKLVHISNLFINEKQPILAKKLIQKGFSGKVFFANSGAEANEGLIKLARKFGAQTGRFEIIVIKDSFHGRTLATLAATGRDKYRKGFAPDMQGFVHVNYNDIDSFKNAVSEKTAAVLIEPVQGEGGVIPAEKEYLQALRDICSKKEILLMFDEVQCGIGRTGSFYAWQHYGVQPDALSMAKALGNGFPIGAFIVSDKYCDILTAGTHASTFGGTPLACAAAEAVLDTFDSENILDKCRSNSEYIFEKLEKLKEKFTFIQDIRGVGLMIGIVLDRPAGELKKIIDKYNLLTLTAGENVLRLLPPLNVSKKEIDDAVVFIERACDELTAENQ